MDNIKLEVSDINKATDYLNSDNSLKDSAPNELKAFYYRAALHGLDDCLKEVYAYVDAHPKVIDLSITELMKVYMNGTERYGKKAVEFQRLVMLESDQKLSDKIKALEKLKEIDKLGDLLESKIN